MGRAREEICVKVRRQKRSGKEGCSDVEVRTVEEKLRDDDECCIIGHGPSHEVMKMKTFREDEDEEISILSERGHVACRDFPHPRHLCVEYPFRKTSHEKYCAMCYCYICEVAAPCKSWTGKSGHCHASDKSK
ncbi:hypothetical protein J5N97_008312 [Dioscorea zingiberensis]|uniref:Uncharacterized protein n=1 Tax=Dioscorea zingiberensis TaxID=325984 RepID=A0A9D5HVV8_9LILI|nr:hypothetical protein J5N97_008312 [Dioscorea zingiberensis]